MAPTRHSAAPAAQRCSHRTRTTRRSSTSAWDPSTATPGYGRSVACTSPAPPCGSQFPMTACPAFPGLSKCRSRNVNGSEPGRSAFVRTHRPPTSSAAMSFEFRTPPTVTNGTPRAIAVAQSRQSAAAAPPADSRGFAPPYRNGGTASLASKAHDDCSAEPAVSRASACLPQRATCASRERSNRGARDFLLRNDCEHLAVGLRLRGSDAWSRSNAAL